MLNSIFVILGTIIGAGFASGKEIYSFFAFFGLFGLFGLSVSMLIIGVVIFKVLHIVYSYNIISYSNLVDLLFSKSNFLKFVFYDIINIFLLISFIIMVAGFSSCCNEMFNISKFIGSIIICLFSYLVFINQINGIIKLNKYITPFIVFTIIIFGLRITSFDIKSCLQESSDSFKLVLNSIIYANYNLIVVLPILTSFKKYIHRKSQITFISISTTLILILLASIVFVLTLLFRYDIQNLDLPMAYISSQLGYLYKILYFFVILFSIFTTAISSGFGFINNLNIQNKSILQLTITSMCLVAILCCNIGFGRLISLIYPFLGFLGSVQIFLIVFLPKNLEKKLFY